MIEPDKALKYFLMIIRLDAGPVVTDINYGLAIIFRYRYLDDAVSGCVLYRVIQNIG